MPDDRWMSETQDLVGSKAVCSRLDINRSTLTQWVRLGRITPAVRLPGRNGAMLFNRRDVDKLEAEYTGTAA